MTDAAPLKLYNAIVWFNGSDQPGKRLEVYAENLDIAREKLYAEFGEDITYTLYNEEDASRPR